MNGLGSQAAAWTLPAAAVAFVALAVAETHWPRWSGVTAGARWTTNLGLYSLVVAAGALLAPQQLLEVALGGWDKGPLASMPDHLGMAGTLIAGLLLLDGLSYALHRLQHRAPFWRLHAVHHADTALDATTGLRHHPGEYLVTVLIGGGVLVLVGLPAWVAPIYGLLVATFDLWTHANIALPPRLERALSAVVVTPGVHHLHHSADRAHFDTNFGSVLSIWDRMFGTWHSPTLERLRFGLAGVAEQSLLAALHAPFCRSARSSSFVPEKLCNPERGIAHGQSAGPAKT